MTFSEMMYFEMWRLIPGFLAFINNHLNSQVSLKSNIFNSKFSLSNIISCSFVQKINLGEIPKLNLEVVAVYLFSFSDKSVCFSTLCHRWLETRDQVTEAGGNVSR